MYLARPYPDGDAQPGESAVLPSLAAGEEAVAAAAESVALDFLLLARGEFGVTSADDLILDHTQLHRYTAEYSERGFDVAVKYRQAVGGVPVLGSFHLVAMTAHGRVYIAKNNAYPDLYAATTPDITAEEAVALAQARFDSDTPPREPPRLAILPQGGVGVLVWELQFEGEVGRRVLVDAATGAVVKDEPNYVGAYRMHGHILNQYVGLGNLGLKGANVRVYRLGGMDYLKTHVPEDGYYDTGYVLPEGASVFLRSDLDGDKIRVEDADNGNEVAYMRSGPWTVPFGTGVWSVDQEYDDDPSPEGFDTFEAGQCMRELQRGYEYAQAEGYENPNKVKAEIRSGGGPLSYGEWVKFPDGRARLDGGVPSGAYLIDDTLNHEYAHCVHYAGLGGEFSWLHCEGHLGADACGANCGTDDCDNHGGSGNACSCDALNEGWADFFPVALYHSYNSADASYGWTDSTDEHDLESNSYFGRLGANDGGWKEEAAVASALWDVFDTNSDAWDTLSLGIDEILHVLTTLDPYTAEEFFSDFVSTFPEYGADMTNIFGIHGMSSGPIPWRAFLAVGWNLTGDPGDPTSLPECTVDDGIETMSWDDALAIGWIELPLYWWLAGPEGGYRGVWADGSLQTGHGHWILANHGCKLRTPPQVPTVPYAVGLGVGWNMIGDPVFDEPLSGSAVSDGAATLAWADAVAAGWVEPPIYFYESGPGGGWRTVAVSGGDDDALRQAHGHWMLANQPGLTLIVPQP